jgi:transmembrane sensor
VESHRQIEEHAARLLAKRDSGSWGQADQAQLESWMGQTTAHRVAVLRLEAAWDEARRLKAVAAGLRPGTVPPPGAWRQTPFFGHGNRRVRRLLTSVSFRKWPAGDRRRRWRMRALPAVAAILLAMIGGSFILATAALDRGRYTTSIGQVASVRLPDGSTMTLNTDSEARIKYSRAERRVDLARGEAFFDDIKDPRRPFVVYAGDKRVVAVGTAFAVSMDNHDIRVVVIQGRVRFQDSKTAATPTAHGEPAPRAGGMESPPAQSTDVLLNADTIARAAGGDLLVQNISITQAEQVLSWRKGFLTFHDTTLVDAIEQLNRYNRHKIIIADPTVAVIRISGTFRPTDYEAFVHLLQEAYSIRAATTEDQTRLGKK